MATVDGILKTWTSGTLVFKDSYMSSWATWIRVAEEMILRIEMIVWSCSFNY